MWGFRGSKSYPLDKSAKIETEKRANKCAFIEIPVLIQFE